MLDRQPLLGPGPLPDWLRNLARRGAGPIEALGNFADNLHLWRCIAVHQGAQPDQSTLAARELSNGYFKLRSAPMDKQGHIINGNIPAALRWVTFFSHTS